MADTISADRLPLVIHVCAATGNSVSTLAPGEAMHIPIVFSEPFPAATIAAIANNTLGMFCFGKITYEDIYGKAHTTNFRAMWTDRNTFSACEKGNEAD